MNNSVGDKDEPKESKEEKAAKKSIDEFLNKSIAKSKKSISMPFWPMRCFNGHIICTVKNITIFENMVEGGYEMGDILDYLNFKNICCRTIIMTTVGKLD